MKNPEPLSRIIKIISDIFNPLCSFLVFFFYKQLQEKSLGQTLLEFLPVFLLLIFPVFFWIFRKVRSGKYGNADVSDRHQRKSLYFFLDVALLVFLLFEYFTTHKISPVIFFILLLSVALQISNYFIKSSMHTAFNLFVTVLFFGESKTMGFIWLGITLLVAFTRLYLKRHTKAEVLSGFLISLVTGLTYAYLYLNLMPIFK